MFKPKVFVQQAKKTRKKASIVMVTFNRWSLTAQSLNSIFKNTHLPRVLTVVDNASWDGTREKLKLLKRAGKINRLILLPKNMGIGKGKNFGLKAWKGKADWYCCIDNDIKVSPYWLSYLCFVSTLPKKYCGRWAGMGIIGCNVQGFGESGGLSWYKITRWKNVHGIALDNCPNPGGIYVMSASTFRKLGYFRQFSLYGLEDSELHGRQKHYKLRSAYVRNVKCRELKDEKFVMRSGKSYRAFKTATHTAILNKIRILKKRGTYRNLKRYETSVTLKEIEKYTYRG